RAGLPWPPRNQDDYRWWSNDKNQQMRNRKIYHGLRLLSLHIINGLIGRAIEESADREALKAARRFSFKYREQIYSAVTRSHRALQLTETFPLLALSIYSDVSFIFIDPAAGWPEWNVLSKELNARKREAATLVERGAKLRDIAGLLGTPMALRHLKPGAAH